MMLQKWASNPPRTQPHENEPALSQDTRRQENVANLTKPVPSQAIVQAVFEAPLDIQSLVAQQLSNADIASISSVCRESRQTFWESEGVWLARAAPAGIPLGRSGVAKFTRESYRRAAHRIDCSDLALLAGAPQANADSNLFNEASHVLQGLMPADAVEIQVFCDLMAPALESLNFVAAASAEAFLRKAHRRTDLFSRKDLEMLDGAYDYALLQHNLMMDTIEDHLGDWEMQMQSVEQQVCEDHRSLIMDQ
jgi:hypothetical protein